MAIFVLNLFLGWTFVGWVVALVWANMDQPRDGYVELSYQAGSEDDPTVRHVKSAR
jgi:hypothetical protein